MEKLISETSELYRTPLAPPESTSKADEIGEYYIVPRGRYLPLFTYVPIIIPLMCAVPSADATYLPYIDITLKDRGLTLSRNSDSKARVANGTRFPFHGSTSLRHQFFVRFHEDARCTWYKNVVAPSRRKTFCRRPRTKAYKFTSLTTLVILKTSTQLNPLAYTVIKVEFTDRRNDEIVLLNDNNNDTVQFQESLIHPEEHYAVALVYNSTRYPIELPGGTELRKTSIVRP
uniref:Fibronectin type-III domain-containing protein n=1 Tax=Heterorhabditis bacteriophora TaxID=37862 RepID=A0A1I7WGB2_HETBA